MTVYIEYVFVSNFVFDFVLLYFTTKISRQKVTKLRLFLATLCGTSMAIFLPLLNLGYVFSVLSKLALSVLIVLVLGAHKSKKQFVATLLLFWGLTFGMGGVLVGIYFISGQDFALMQDLSVVSDSPLPLYVGGLLIFVFVVKNLVSYVNAKKANTNFEYDVTVVFGGQKFALKGFLDSGNQLCDDATNLPVVIVTSSKVRQTFGNKIAECLVSKNVLVKNVHYVRFSTLSGGSQKMLVFGVDKVIVDGKQHDVLIGLSQTDMHFGGDCDLLLNAKMSL